MLGSHRILIPVIIPLLAMIGCSEEATRIAREAANRQAQQNTSMAELNKEVASGSRRLVDADAQARKDIVGVHHDLQLERGRLDSSWSTLESERKQLAADRRTESFLVSVAPLIGGSLLVVVFLGFCWWMLVASTSDPQVDARLSHLLVAELLPDQSTLSLSDESKPHQLPRD